MITRKMTKSKITTILSLLCICTILSIVCDSYTGYRKNKAIIYSPHRLLQDDYDRPVMHTFYQASQTGTGMKMEDDRRMLEIWMEAWDAAGWETKVLVLDDAKEHPDYDLYYHDLDQNANDDYNKLCYLRWLAMTVEGGGWMCDYDVFPMPTSHEFQPIKLNPAKEGENYRLPFQGKFTVYEYTRDGGVPSLMSGSKEEWNRMTNLILERSYQERIHSDMYALMDIHQQDPKSFIMVDKVVKGYLPMRELEVTRRTCNMFFKHMAIHMSHFAISTGKESGRLPTDLGASARPQVAMDFIKHYIAVCQTSI